MNSTVKAILGFVFGALVGGGVTYFILDKRYSEAFEEELEEYKAQIEEEKKQESAKEVKNDEPDKEIPSEVVEKVKEMQEGIRKSSNRNITRNDNPNTKTNYSSLSKPNNTNTGGLVNMADQFRPYRITEDEFYENPDDYNQLEFCYDPEGDLRDIDGEIVENVDHQMGLANIEPLDTGEVDEIYIRNDYYKELYHIDCTPPGLS